MKLRKAIMIDEAVYRDILDFAENNGISFSGAVSVLAKQALEQSRSVDVLEQLTQLYRSGKFDKPENDK